MRSNFNINGVWQSVNDLWLPFALVAVGSLVTILLIRFLMKKKWTGAVVMFFITMLMVGGGMVYRLPHRIIDIHAGDVSRIAVSDVEVTDAEMIENILADLNSSEYKRTLPSGIGGRQVYSIRVYDNSGELIFSMGIADESMIDTGIFWEEREEGEFDLSLYQSITETEFFR